MNGFDWMGVSFDWQTFSTQVAMTLLHFIWQAAIVGAFLAVALRALCGASANSRYVASCCALFVLPVAAVFTFVVQPAPKEMNHLGAVAAKPGADTVEANVSAGVALVAMVDQVEPPTERVGITLSEPEPDRFAGPDQVASSSSLSFVSWRPLVSRFSPGLAVAYVFGVLFMLTRMLVAVWRAYSIRRAAQPMFTGDLAVLVQRLAKEMGLRVAPAIAYCERVTVPVVVGILKPTILLPASMVTSLSTEELAAILSHELAHIRRFDLIVNLMQRMVESLLFFHPVVWWVSRHVHIERENCCDDLAVATGVSDTQYVAALLRMAELCLQSRGRKASQKIAAMAADGSRPSQLSRRIERLLKIRTAPRFAVSRLVSLSAAFVIAATIASVAGLNLLGQAEAATPQNEKEDAEVVDVAVDAAAADAEKELVMPDVDTDGIVWGEAVEGVRMGVRSASFAKRATSFRHGDWLRYEVWVKNDRENTIVVPGDPAMKYRPQYRDGSINVVGSSSWMSFRIPQSAYIAARIGIPPGESRPLGYSPQCPIREPGAKPGRFGPNALTLPPGEYPLYAATHLNVENINAGDDGEVAILDLRSGNIDIEILPAARLQLRRVDEVSTKLTPEQLAKDPSRQVFSWLDHDDKEHHFVLNLNSEIILEEDDLLSFPGLHPLKSTTGAPSEYNLVVELKGSAISRMSQESKRMIGETERRKDSGVTPMLAVFLDGKLLSAAKLKRPIRLGFRPSDRCPGRAPIPCNLKKADADLLESFLSERFATCPCQTAWVAAPEEGFRVGARLEVAEDSERSLGSLALRFRLYNVSGKTQTVRVKLSDGTTVTKTLKHGKVVPIAESIEIGKNDALPGKYGIEKFEKQEGASLHRWTVKRTVDGVVAMETKVESPVQSLTILESGDESPEVALLKPTKVFPDHLNVMALGIDDPSENIVTVATSKNVTVRTWDLAKAELRSQVILDTDAHANQFHNAGLTVSRDLSQILAVVKGQVHIWDVLSGKLNARLPNNEGQSISTRGLSCTDDMSLVAAGIASNLSGAIPLNALPDCSVVVWDAAKQSVLREFTHPNALQLTSVAISPDGRWLASGCQAATTCIFDVKTGKRMKRLENLNTGHTHPDEEVSSDGANQIVCLAFSPDGNQLAIGDMLGVKLIETDTGRVIQKFDSPFRYGSSNLVFSDDGGLVSRTGTDKLVPVWSTRTGELIAELPTESHAGAFSRDGEWFATGFTDHERALSLWRIADANAGKDLP